MGDQVIRVRYLPGFELCHLDCMDVHNRQLQAVHDSWAVSEAEHVQCAYSLNDCLSDREAEPMRPLTLAPGDRPA